MIASLTKAIEDMPTEDLEKALIPIFQNIWPALNQILNGRANDIDLVNITCDIIVNMCRALKNSFGQFFDTVH